MQSGAKWGFSLHIHQLNLILLRIFSFSRFETYISQQSNKGLQPVSNPYWINLNTLGSSLSAPVEAVPNISREIILSSLAVVSSPKAEEHYGTGI